MTDTLSFQAGPQAPEGVRAFPKITTLSSMCERMTATKAHPLVDRKVSELLNSWLDRPDDFAPYLRVQELLETIRNRPVGDERVMLMNSVVRTLGAPAVLATFLDMLRWAAKRDNPVEGRHLEKIQNVRLHSIYGWCGNTMLVESEAGATVHSYIASQGLGEKLGNPPYAWNLTIHVWQPNTRAVGFKAGNHRRAGTVSEPPHSHPFDFVSKVVMGQMRQSIYRPAALSPRRGKYDQTPLEHVDGVWPPHDFRASSSLTTVEEVALSPGDSYYMPCDWIHDVEIDLETAATTPTITLFLSSEYMVVPHVYMAKSMVEYHDRNPNIKTFGRPISASAWDEKVSRLASYLRGEIRTLDLNDLVDHQLPYAFFHV